MTFKVFVCRVFALDSNKTKTKAMDIDIGQTAVMFVSHEGSQEVQVPSFKSNSKKCCGHFWFPSSILETWKHSQQQTPKTWLGCWPIFRCVVAWTGTVYTTYIQLWIVLNLWYLKATGREYIILQAIASNPPACRRVWLEGVVFVSVLGLYLFLFLACTCSFVLLPRVFASSESKSPPLLSPPSPKKC